ncbi:SPFH domain/Band 7 family protein [Gramella sp. Hel_I_59]|uniref:SPFH domain-containing protein n=1 Tax=Gramella sp. Hel_I_59 TaxID=1249978 RepID=UPI0011538FD8|nr:SPFH domain-containing protein [Gramella sp. Hel_I_59]TQI72285.1 SPFH domain/Band 7 family protein [Gramella sp. Hel_I_59]
MGQIQQFIEYIFNALKIWVIVQPWEAGIRVRNGKKIKKLDKGIHFKLPYFDSVYVQEIRLRVRELPMQTLTSKDLKTITLNSSIGYSIRDIEKLYQTLYRPEMTLQNIAMSAIAEVVYTTNARDVSPELLEKSVLSKLSAEDYGLNYEYFKVTNFAVVRTYRLIQDQSWVDSGFSLNEKK